jgi:ketosteroid isomerase-like protein
MSPPVRRSEAPQFPSCSPAQELWRASLARSDGDVWAYAGCGARGFVVSESLCDNLSPNRRKINVQARFDRSAVCARTQLFQFCSFKVKEEGRIRRPDKAYLQKILDGWNAMNVPNMAHYYDQGDYNFFDIAPLKYNNWAEYQKGVTELLKGFKNLKLTLNDDTQIHTDGNLTWSTTTVKQDAVTTAGKHEMATLRWTLIFEKQSGKWMIVHEHMSEPLQ